MIDGTGLLDTSQVAGTLAGTKIKQVEQFAQRGDMLKASQEFESYFVSYMLKVMRETIPQGELTANKMGDMFQSFYDQEIGKRAAQSGSLGLSDYVLASVARNEDLARSPSNPSISVKS